MLACGIDGVTVLRSLLFWMTFDFGDAGLLTICFALCESDGENDVTFCPPFDCFPFENKNKKKKNKDCTFQKVENFFHCTEINRENAFKITLK